MNELRWILLAAGVLVLALIYWQGRRKRLAADDRSPIRESEPPQLSEQVVTRRRESTITITPLASRLVMDDLPEVRVNAPSDSQPSEIRTSVAPLSMDEALSTAALDRLTITQPLNARDAVVTPPRPVVEDRPHSIPRPSPAATAPRVARKIVALRVPAAHRSFSGAQLKEFFIEQGLRHGRYGIYHRTDSLGTPIFSVASIVEPGTFDLATMINDEYPGISLFLQLPGPTDGIAAFDAMLMCAQRLQVEFNGTLQGERGKPLTDEIIVQMREDIADFEHLTRAAPAGT